MLAEVVNRIPQLTPEDVAATLVERDRGELIELDDAFAQLAGVVKEEWLLREHGTPAGATAPQGTANRHPLVEVSYIANGYYLPTLQTTDGSRSRHTNSAVRCPKCIACFAASPGQPKCRKFPWLQLFSRPSKAVGGPKTWTTPQTFPYSPEDAEDYPETTNAMGAALLVAVVALALRNCIAWCHCLAHHGPGCPTDLHCRWCGNRSWVDCGGSVSFFLQGRLIGFAV